MRRLARLPARLLFATALCLIGGAIGSASPADTSNGHGRSTASLRHADASLTQRIDTATLDVYSLDAQLTRAQNNLAALASARARIEQERASVRLQLRVTRHNARIAGRRVAMLVSRLYEQQSSDPLAVMLGANSLEDALTTLDDLSRSAQSNRQVADTSQHARHTLATVRDKLAREDAHVRALEAAAAQNEASLAAARDARRQLISKLANERSLNQTQITRIAAIASASAAASASTATPAAASVPAPVAAVTPGSNTMTVTATGYSMGGTTASGLPVGWGTVAVDPSVIPLGTRLTIPGYGSGVAADTGSAVGGATIDLWFPTVQQANAWGRRVVVISLQR